MLRDIIAVLGNLEKVDTTKKAAQAGRNKTEAQTPSSQRARAEEADRKGTRTASETKSGKRRTGVQRLSWKPRAD